MATTAYGVNNPLAQKLWSKVLIVEALKATWFSKFMGEDSSSLCQIKTETQKSRGDRITVGLRMQLTGSGIQGDATLEGNEEALTTYSDNVYIDQLRHAVRTAGNMSQQRVPFDVREEAKNGLVDWWAGRLDTSFFNQLCGYTAQSDTRYTGNQATIAASTSYLKVAGGASFGSTEANSLSASTVMYLKFADIDQCVAQAKTLVPMIRPLKVRGEDKYVMFLHPFQVLQLRKDASTAGNFIDISKSAMTGGLVADNPIYTGAMGEYNGVILHEAFRVTNAVAGQGSDQTIYRRAPFCGAQALLCAFGNGYGSAAKPNWVEELFDYGNQLGVSGGMIFGIKKAQFNSTDFGVLIVASYAPSP